MGFDTLLIANRGEIAVRIARTARRMGIRTVAVHSTADAASPHVAACDLDVPIGPPPAVESYLVIDKIIAAARSVGAGAIHPGYGFLSENATFAEACEAAEIVFVGPRPRAIREMGDKAAAKRLMRTAGVPVVPGYEGADQSDDRLSAEAEQIGFPLMVKAAAGGGGKGMRLVLDATDLRAALAAARRESLSAFGSNVLLLERAVIRPRHVEVQVLADAHGQCIHLGERDCSVQRRHQKVLEECPSPAVDAELRARMGAAAVAAAQAVDYIGAGTVEFLLDASGEFFFLEMNTRLQVEHPVTEFVTGLDLVEWQLRVARGEELRLAQDDVELRGHAVEARLYAEDPPADYRPSTGVVNRWETPSGEGVRIDSGIAAGSEITAHYDPMIAKVIAHGTDRDDARTRLIRALQQTTALGTITNRTMLISALRDPVFAAGQATTAFLDERSPAVPYTETRQLAAIAAARYDADRRGADPALGLAGWSSTSVLTSRRRWRVGDREHVITIHERAHRIEIAVGSAEHHVVLNGERPLVDDIPVSVRIAEPTLGRIVAATDDADLEIADLTVLSPEQSAGTGAGVLAAPMHGKVIAVEVEPGASVVQGQRLIVLEAMKMEHEIVADVDGIVNDLVSANTQVSTDQVLARITSTGAAATQS